MATGRVINIYDVTNANQACSILFIPISVTFINFAAELSPPLDKVYIFNKALRNDIKSTEVKILDKLRFPTQTLFLNPQY